MVSGKGGVGKTTVASSLAALAARSGRSVLLVSTDGRGDAAALFGREDRGYEEAPLEDGLRTITADFDPLLADFVHVAVPLRVLGDRLLALDTFRFFTRATPGLPDLLLLGKIREILKRTRGTAKALLAQRTDLAPEYIESVVRHGLKSMPPFVPSDLTEVKLKALVTFLTRK